MKLKLMFLLLMTIVLSGCTVGESNIAYNKYVEDTTIKKISCGRGTQITLTVDGKDKVYLLPEDDCYYLLDHKESLKVAGENTDIKIDFITNGEWIEGIKFSD